MRSLPYCTCSTTNEEHCSAQWTFVAYHFSTKSDNCVVIISTTRIGINNRKYSLRSIVWNKHERQKECPQGVVIGSYSNFRQSVQSKSSECSGTLWPLVRIKLDGILSKLRRETRRMSLLLPGKKESFRMENFLVSRSQIKINHKLPERIKLKTRKNNIPCHLISFQLHGENNKNTGEIKTA